MKIGAQLYTVREFAKTPEALAETLSKVANIGYTTVQVSGTCDYDADWLRSELDKNGLACVETHYSPAKILEDTAAVCAVHARLGCRYVGIGSMPNGGASDEGYPRFVSDYKSPAEQLRDSGFLFMFHNHWKEFGRMANGRRYLEALAEDFPHDTLGFTFDTYWAQFAGADPVQWLGFLHGRVPCIHLKDMSCVDKVQRMEAVGSGNMNFPAIINAASDAGSEFLLVEQDNCNGLSPFDCLADSYKYLKSLGLE